MRQDQRAQRVQLAPKSRIRKNSGMVSASTGTICATRNMISRVVRKRKRNRVTAVAARNAISAGDDHDRARRRAGC